MKLQFSQKPFSGVSNIRTTKKEITYTHKANEVTFYLIYGILTLCLDSFLPISSQESKAWRTDFITEYEEFKALFRRFVSFPKLVQNPPLTNSLFRNIFDQGNCNIFPSAVYQKKEMLICIARIAKVKLITIRCFHNLHDKITEQCRSKDLL